MLRGHIKKGIFKLITILALNLIFGSQAVFAVDNITVDITPSSVNLSLTPGVFASTSQTVTVTSSSEAGYVVNLAPTGSTNALVHQSDPTITIPTFTLPSGSSSLSAGSTGNGYGYSIDSGANYLPVPAPSSSSRLFETSSAGTDEYGLTFGALVPLSQPQGTYTGSVTIQAVAKLDPCLPNKICYYGNGDDVVGEMPDQDATSGTDTVLIAPNFSKF